MLICLTCDYKIVADWGIYVEGICTILIQILTGY
jgi:hypothetical protein